MNKYLACAIAATLFTPAAAWSADASSACNPDAVGAWVVQVKGAPFEPHLFIFHSDGTMNTTNPTNVQEDAAKPHGGTNDSLGMGVWTCGKNGTSEIVGTFSQLNANADDHKPTDSLFVTFKIEVSKDTFVGKAAVKVGDTPVPGATFEGKRITIDESALGGL